MIQVHKQAAFQLRIFFILVFFVSLAITSNACPLCEKQQPKILRGITHGAGPQSNWDWVIVGFITVVALLTLFYSVKYLLLPKEKNNNHIKNFILEQQ